LQVASLLQPGQSLPRAKQADSTEHWAAETLTPDAHVADEATQPPPVP